MGLFKKKPPAEPEDEKRPSSAGNPYLNARVEWLERYGSYISRAAQWRSVAFITLIIAVMSLACNVIQANQVKTVPYIIEVDKLGKRGSPAADTGDHRQLHPAMAHGHCRH